VDDSKPFSSTEYELPRVVAETMDSVALDYEYESVVHGGQSARPRSPASRRSTFLHRLLAAADSTSALLSGLFAGLVFGLSLGSTLILTAALLVFWVGLAFVFGLYSESGLRNWASGLSDAPRLATAALLLTWPVLGLTELLPLQSPVLTALVVTTAIASADAIARGLARGYAHRVAPLRQRTVIVGSGLVADRLAERIQQHSEFGLETIGLVDDDVHSIGDEERLPKLGSLADLDDLLAEKEVDRVIIAFSRAGHQELLECIRACRNQRVAVDMVPRLFELVDSGRSVTQIGGMPVLSIGAPPLGHASRVAKRAVDIAGSGLALILLSPFLILIALAIKLTSRGPVFFRQERAGRGGSTFEVFKFRTMRRDAEERKRDYQSANEAGDGVMFKIKDDPRITVVGGFLRRTSLDELPQLINVLTGEMSLVGPRPLILSEAEQAAQSWHARRLDLRPGITGLWQVSGRSDLPFQEMVRFDYQYVSGWSIARDIEILLATIPVVLSGRGAY
jgi:exopolysaccharide biosynthesis polyprenyl glycosylphosphotransferase